MSDGRRRDGGGGGRSGAARPAAVASGGATLRVRAGCGRERDVPRAEADGGGAPPVWAYLELAFPECPGCPHRVAPEGAAPFCAWRPADAPHPFAGLADWTATP